MAGNEARSAKWDSASPAHRVAARAGQHLVTEIVERGMSEREVCLFAGVSKSSWRRQTGRPFPSDPPTASLLTLRDFIAVAIEVKLDPAEVLKTALAAAR